ncbi:MAG: response regulator, partial [Porticoccaceae bacterium]
MKPTIWIVDDDKSIRWVMERALEKADMTVECFEDAQSVLKRLDRGLPDTLISDIRMPGMNGLELLERLRRENPAMPVI